MFRLRTSVIALLVTSSVLAPGVSHAATRNKPLPPRVGTGVQWFFGGSAEVDATDDLGRIVTMESTADKVVTYEVFSDSGLFNSRPFAVIVTNALIGQPLAWLERLGAEFHVESGDVCRNGAPRFRIALDVNLDGDADTFVEVYLGADDPHGPCQDGWNSFDNLLTDELPRFEIPGVGWYLGSWASVVGYFGQARVHSIWFEVDGTPILSTQQVQVSTLAVNQHRFTASKAVKYLRRTDREIAFARAARPPDPAGAGPRPLSSPVSRLSAS